MFRRTKRYSKRFIPRDHYWQGGPYTHKGSSYVTTRGKRGYTSARTNSIAAQIRNDRRQRGLPEGGDD